MDTPIMVRKHLISLAFVSSLTTRIGCNVYLSFAEANQLFVIDTPRWLSYIMRNNTMLIYIPNLKAAAEGKGSMLIAKPTGDCLFPV